MLILCHAWFSFRDLESFLRIVVGLYEDDVQLILGHFNSKFITYETAPGIYSFRAFSEAICFVRDHQGTLQMEYDVVRTMTKIILNLFSGTLRTLWFDEKSFFNTLLIFTASWNYKPTSSIHANYPGVNTG